MHYQVSFTLSLKLVLPFSTTWTARGLSPVSCSQISTSFAGVGVTSILPIPTVLQDDSNLRNDGVGDDIHLSFYVGTKRGKVKKVTLDPKQQIISDNDDDVIQIQCIQDKNDDKRKTPYPIFSMMSLSFHNSCHHVLTGSGNRFITVWEENQQDSSWNSITKLGPHTGWVKDLASNPPHLDSPIHQETQYIFSIGCNCIEIWSTIHGEGYEHVHKLMIESSVDMGSTLSSDILCLATSQLYHHNPNSENDVQNHSHYYYLLAGGVDGRIHRWTICNNSFLDAPVSYGSAHNGRLNSLLVCNDLQVVVSVGNDGLVKFWKLDCDDDCFMEKCVSSLDINQEYDKNEQEDRVDKDKTIKLTCSCILSEQQDHVVIGIGTACGKVFLTEISKRRYVEEEEDDTVMSITLLEERTTVESSSSSDSTINRGCIIHSIASQHKHLIIGHSQGISIWEPSAIY